MKPPSYFLTPGTADGPLHSRHRAISHRCAVRAFMWSLRMMGGVTKRRQGELMAVLASSSGESTHDPPDGVLDRGRPVVVMDAFSLHGEAWCLSSPLSSALELSRHHHCEFWSCSRRVLVFIFFHCCLFCGNFE